MPRQRARRIDPYPGPDAVWHFLERNRRPIRIVVCAVVAVGATWTATKFWRGGGCIGSEAERAVVAALLDDPLLAGPPGARRTSNSTAYIGCQTANYEPGWYGHMQPPPPPIAAQIVRDYSLANAMSVAQLHDYYAARDDPWRLTHAEANSLSYCRVLAGHRVVSTMTVDDRRLATQAIVWADASGCSAEVTLES